MRRLVQPDEGVLRNVKSVGIIAQDRAGESKRAGLVTFDELIESPTIARSGFSAQFLIRQLRQSGRPRSRSNSAARCPYSTIKRRTLRISREGDATPPDVYDETRVTFVYAYLW